MKQLARAILRAIINDLPNQQREYGQAMLVELEETNGLQALVWASGGIQLWAQTRGGAIMKNAAFWFGLVAIGILAGGLYVTRGLYWAVPVVAVGVIAFAAFRPRDAMPVALLLGLSLPIADLFQVWIAMREFLTDVKGGSFSGTLVLAPAAEAILYGTGKSAEINKANEMVLSGAVRMMVEGPNTKIISPDISSFMTIPTNYLLQLTVAVLLGAIVVAGVSAFIRSRVAARNVIAQN
jgi:hypothetical protein